MIATVIVIEMLAMLLVVSLNVWGDRRRRARDEAEETRRRNEENRLWNAAVSECFQELQADVDDLNRLRADVESRLWVIKNKRRDAAVN